MSGEAGDETTTVTTTQEPTPEAVQGLQAAVARERAQARELQTELDRLKSEAAAREEAELSEQQKLQKDNERLKAENKAAADALSYAKWETRATDALNKAGISATERTLKLLDPAAEDVAADVQAVVTEFPGLVSGGTQDTPKTPPSAPAGLVPQTPPKANDASEAELGGFFGNVLKL